MYNVLWSVKTFDRRNTCFTVISIQKKATQGGDRGDRADGGPERRADRDWRLKTWVDAFLHVLPSVGFFSIHYKWWIFKQKLKKDHFTLWLPVLDFLLLIIWHICWCFSFLTRTSATTKKGIFFTLNNSGTTDQYRRIKTFFSRSILPSRTVITELVTI